MAECVFCEIVQDRARPRARVVRRWADALAIEPLAPVVEGHILVIPNAHVWSFLADPVVSAATMARAAEYAADRFGHWNLITSAGDHATQTVHHLHLHLIPRRQADQVSLPWDVRGG